MSMSVSRICSRVLGLQNYTSLDQGQWAVKPRIVRSQLNRALFSVLSEARSSIARVRTDYTKRPSICSLGG